MKRYIILFAIATQVIAAPVFSQKLSGKPTALLTADLKYWDTFLGVPHTSVALQGYPKGDGMNGIPIGLNKDPLHVFSVEMMDGQPVLHISGQMYGGLSTKQKFENYHLKVEFKWGGQKYEPRLKDKRDNGIIYHATGPHGQFWNVWMRGHEFQVQEGDMGDYYSLSGVGMDINASTKPNPAKKEWVYNADGPLVQFTSNRTPASTCLHAGNYEKPNGEWNTLELYCYGDKSIHVVNGHVVMVLQNSRLSPNEGPETGYSKGKIQIQSEGAEAYYRNITITRLTSLPAL